MEPSSRRDLGRPASWLPAYLVLLVAICVTPMSLTSVAGPVFTHASPRDLIANVLLYVPLGWALARRPLLLVALAATTLSVGVEGAQRYLLRTASTWDVLANVVGALIGARLSQLAAGPIATRVAVSLRAFTWASWASWAAPPALALCLGLLALAVPHRPVSMPRSWQDASLWVGHSSLANAPFMGRLLDLRVFDRFPRNAGRRWATGGPILHLSASAGMMRLDGPEGPRELPLPAALEVTGAGLGTAAAGVQLGPVASRHVLARVKQSGTLALWVSLEAPAPAAGDTAAIVSLQSPTGGNLFSLLRDARGVALRLPAPGDPHRHYGPGALVPRGNHHVLASFDGHWARLVVDGSLGHQNYLPSRLTPWAIGGGVTLSSVIVVLLAAITAGRLWRRRRGRRLAMLLGALAAHGTLIAIGLLGMHAEPFAALAVSVAAGLSALPLAQLFDGEQPPRPAR